MQSPVSENDLHCIDNPRQAIADALLARFQPFALKFLLFSASCLD